MLLDDKSKQRHEVKFDNIQGYNPFQIKKEEPSGDICKIPAVAYRNIVNYVLWIFIESTD